MNNEWTVTGAEVLKTAKLLSPPNSPAADADLAETWGEEMFETGIPASVWKQAVRLWGREWSEERLDFRLLWKAARKVIERLESGTYEQRLWVEQWRARRLQDRYRALGLGDGGIEIPSAPQDRSLPPDRRADEQFLAQLRSASQNANKDAS